MNKLKIVIPVLVLAIGGVAAALLIGSREPVATEEAPVQVPLVRVLEVTPEDHVVTVSAQGNVLPPTEATLAARVAGEVVAVGTSFVAGGLFRRGDLLVRLEARDYELVVETARSEVAQVDLELVRERAEARLAAEEWQELGDGGEPDPLVLRVPQIARLEAARRAAEARVARAELDLERTTIRAPYDGRIRAIRVGRGQFVSPGAPLATIHATDHAEVRLPVTDDELAFLAFDWWAQPSSRDGSGPEVELTAELAGRDGRWTGRIVRSEGEVDPRTRMINLVAHVDDPYGRARDAKARMPLPIGTFVDAAIRGVTLESVFALPRSALRRGPRDVGYHVLVVDAEGRLEVRAVTTQRIDGDRAIVSEGLNDGERVVISNLEVVVDGMRVRIADTGDDTAPADTPLPAEATPAEATPADASPVEATPVEVSE